jgi:hypothetical protein
MNNLSGKLLINFSKFDLIPKDKRNPKLSLDLLNSETNIQKKV